MVICLSTWRLALGQMETQVVDAVLMRYDAEYHGFA